MTDEDEIALALHEDTEEFRALCEDVAEFVLGKMGDGHSEVSCVRALFRIGVEVMEDMADERTIH